MEIEHILETYVATPISAETCFMMSIRLDACRKCLMMFALVKLVLMECYIILSTNLNSLASRLFSVGKQILQAVSGRPDNL